MSDPVTNVEIEDVLASIRRLVSQGDKTAADTGPRPVPASGVPGTEGDQPDRLVLTPALRVTDGEDVAERVSDSEFSDSEDEDAQGALVVPEEPEHSSAPETEVAEFRIPAPDAPEADEDNSAPNDSCEAELVDVPLTFPKPDIDLSETGPEEAEILSPDADTVPPAPPPSDRGGRATLLATIAELEAAVGGSEGWEPDGSEAEPQVDWDGLSTPPGSARASAAPEPEATLDMTAEMEPAEAETGEVQMRTAEPGDQPDPARSAAPDVDDLMETGPTEDGSEAGKDGPASAKKEAEAPASAEMDEDLSALMAEAGMIDEESLRDMVAEIVRDELHGALGERITRNVRKLVRREIYRILSSQEFD